jgi:hypothetical protein
MSPDARRGGRPLKVCARIYRQFDADLSLEVPGEGYGGWREVDIEIDLDSTALVVMHAWDTGTPAQYPGWYRAVEYLPRAEEISRSVFSSAPVGLPRCGSRALPRRGRR